MPQLHCRPMGSRAARKGSVLIGTSGWTYRDWRGPFYPADVPQRCWLEFYARQFPSTEINGSFYRTPSLQAVEGWRDAVPDGFLFAWKASKFITHWKRLTNPDNSLALIRERLDLLGDKAGPVLFQLPPRMRADRERLAGFLKRLPRRWHVAFEFRHLSWYDDAILTLLAEHDTALCLSDHHDAPAPWIATARHVYVRAHGPRGDYAGRYHGRTLGALARRVALWRRAGRQVFVYFDNDQKSAAPQDAQRLRALVDRRGA